MRKRKFSFAHNSVVSVYLVKKKRGCGEKRQQNEMWKYKSEIKEAPLLWVTLAVSLFGKHSGRHAAEGQRCSALVVVLDHSAVPWRPKKTRRLLADLTPPLGFSRFDLPLKSFCRPVYEELCQRVVLNKWCFQTVWRQYGVKRSVSPRRKRYAMLWSSL